MIDEQNPYDKESGGLINLRIWGMGFRGGRAWLWLGKDFKNKMMAGLL